MVLAVVTLVCLSMLAADLPATAPALPDRGRVTFDHPDGPYTPEMAAADFGNGRPAARRDFGSIVDGALRVTYTAGHKVNDTGFAMHVRLPERPRYTLQFRVRYPVGFESGLHGKQIGLSGGAGYDGGRGQQARENGDGWSARLQFDARDDHVTNQLYVYHARMKGTYGDHLGTAAQKFRLDPGTWHTIRMTVTMQSNADADDGRIEVWQDDQKRFDLGNVRFVTRESGRNINRIRMELFTGGGGKMPERENHVDIDDVTWSAEEPPPAAAPSAAPAR